MRRIARTLLAAVVVACTPSVSAAPPEAMTLDVGMTEFAYSEQLIDVPARRPLRIVLRNDGKVDHDLVIDALGVRSLLRSKERATLNVAPVPAGLYVVYCSIPTHRELGMVATLRAQ